MADVFIRRVESLQSSWVEAHLLMGNTDKKILRSSAAFCVRFSKHHNKPHVELGIGRRGIEVCC